MREYAKKPENQSRTLDSNPRASKQAPISEILQAYRNGTFGKPVQRQDVDEDELLQAKATQQDQVNTVSRRYTPEEDEELIQGKFDTAQREEVDEDELLQSKFEYKSAIEQEPVQREKTTNNTGLPDDLKSGIENLSGYNMDDVKVHYNSDKPAQLQALAYAQGTDIHIAPGEEKHLPHEAWHVVQQKQGRVQPTMQMKGVNINDNERLESEADIMGKEALIQPQKDVFSQLKGGNSLVPLQQDYFDIQTVQLKTENINGTTYVIRNTLGVSNYRIIRQNWHPWGHHYLSQGQEITPGFIMTREQANKLIGLFTGCGLNQGQQNSLVEYLLQKSNATPQTIEGIIDWIVTNQILPLLVTVSCNTIPLVDILDSSLEIARTKPVEMIKDVLSYINSSLALLNSFRNIIGTAGANNIVPMLNHISKEKDKRGMVPVINTPGTIAERLSDIATTIQLTVRQRIEADHQLIRNNFDRGIPMNFNTAFKKMEVSTSDPHKGGQVVIFLTYRTISQGVANNERKIVYKPDNISIDQFVFDSQPNSIATQLNNNMADFISTYRIVNNVDQGASPLYRNYSYMEFVESDHPQNQGEMLAVFNSFGRNFAIAYVYGFRDMHYENFILKRNSIQLIDMEAATGTFSDFDAMEIGWSEIGKKIGSHLAVEENIDWIPAPEALRDEVKNGFNTCLENLGRIRRQGRDYSRLSTRFVPFSTGSLYEMCAMLKLGISYVIARDNMINSAIGNNNQQTRHAYEVMLNHEETRAALQRGNIPFWKRVGNNIYSESGALIVQNMVHPRLNAEFQIQQGIQNRTFTHNVNLTSLTKGINDFFIQKINEGFNARNIN